MATGGNSNGQNQRYGQYGGGGRPQGQQNQSQSMFTRVPVDTTNRYRENAGDSANLLIKEVSATQVQIYYDNTGQIIIPSKYIEEAHDAGEPQAVFKKVPVKEIVDQMQSVFVQDAQPGESPRNPYLVVEQFSVQARIFSYRNVDFGQLYSFLQKKLIQGDHHNNQAQNLKPWAKPAPPMRTGVSREVHVQQFQFFQNEFSLKFALHPAPRCKNIVVNVTPDLVDCLHSLNEYVENYYIAQDLKQYRPQRRPITVSQLGGYSKKCLKSETFKRKRRNVVRDWLYYIVWYVRLKRILDQHKTASAPESPASLLAAGHGSRSRDQAVIKSPIQDPTQLTSMTLVVGLPAVQVKLFESTKKMQEFYSVAQQSPNRNQQQQRPPAQRVAPLSLNVSGALFSRFQDPLTQDYERDVRIKGADVYLTKIQEQRSQSKQGGMMDDGRQEDARAMGAGIAFRGRGAREHSTYSTARGGGRAGPQAQGQMRPGEQQRAPSRPNAFAQNQQMAFKNHKMSTQDFSLSQSLLYDQGTMQQSPPWGSPDRPGNDYGAMQYEQQQPYQQQQSIWSSLFNAFKDLFNMNPRPSDEESPPHLVQQQQLMKGGAQARYSIHRGLAGGAIDAGSPHSGIKGRSSMLQNAQLELTRTKNRLERHNNYDGFAERNQTQVSEFAHGQQRRNLGGPGGNAHHRSGVMDGSSAHLNQLHSFDNSGRYGGPGQEEDDYGGMDAQFAQLVLRHQCIRVDDQDPSQGRRLYDVVQYPLIKTSSPEYSDAPGNEQLLSLGLKTTRLGRLTLQCLMNRPVELTYCAQDILDVLLHQHSVMFQQYVNVGQKLTRESIFAEKTPTAGYGGGIIDFKPLWAIRRSMQQQKSRFLSQECGQLPRAPAYRASIAKPRHQSADDDEDIDDEEGENIVDEEAELQNTLSYIECKPSINQSNKKGAEASALLPKSQKPNSMTQTMQNSMNSKNGGGIMNAQRRHLGGEEQIDSRHLMHKPLKSRGRAGERGVGGLGGFRGQTGLFDDKYLQEILQRYEKSLGGGPVGRAGAYSDPYAPLISIQVNINQPIYLHVLSGDGQARGAEYQPVCRLAIQPAQVQFSRSQHLSSFSAFGLEFESTNKVKVLQLFAQQLRDSVKSFLGSPIIQEHIQGQRVYQRLEQMLRVKRYQKKKFNQVKFTDGHRDQDDLDPNQMLVVKNTRPAQAGPSSPFQQLAQPGAEARNSRPQMKGARPGGQAKPKKQNPKPATLGDELNGANSDSSGSARRRYQDLEDDHTGSEGTSSLQQIPVQIKQVSQLNMQIIYNNITGTAEEKPAGTRP